MATDQPMNPKFTWGDSVQVADEAPSRYRSGAYGSICGIHELESQVLYTVEFGDGAAIEVPEDHLRADGTLLQQVVTPND